MYMIVERSPAPSCLALGAGSKEHHDYFLLNSGKERVCEGLPTPLGKKKKKVVVKLQLVQKSR